MPAHARAARTPRQVPARRPRRLPCAANASPPNARGVHRFLNQCTSLILESVHLSQSFFLQFRTENRFYFPWNCFSQRRGGSRRRLLPGHRCRRTPDAAQVGTLPLGVDARGPPLGKRFCRRRVLKRSGSMSSKDPTFQLPCLQGAAQLQRPAISRPLAEVAETSCLPRLFLLCSNLSATEGARQQKS